MSGDPVVVVVIRAPDCPNEIRVYGSDAAVVIDVDLGYLDLSDPDEFAMWKAGLDEATGPLPADHPARRLIARIVADETPTD